MQGSALSAGRVQSLDQRRDASSESGNDRRIGGPAVGTITHRFDAQLAAQLREVLLHALLPDQREQGLGLETDGDTPRDQIKGVADAARILLERGEIFIGLARAEKSSISVIKLTNEKPGKLSCPTMILITPVSPKLPRL